MSHSAVQPRQCDDGSFIAAHPAAENRYGGLHILLLLLIFLFLTIPVEPIISTGPTFAKLSLSGLVKQNYTAVDERSEINVSIPQGTFPRQAIFAGFIH